MEERLGKKIGDLARENHNYIKIFQKFNLDFFCKGEKNLKEAIEEAGVNTEEILTQLSNVKIEEEASFMVNVETWPLDLLADYIQKTHHKYTDQTLKHLRDDIESFLKKESTRKEAVEALQIPLNAMAGEMGSHMKKEELILFPAIKRIVMARGKIEEPGAKTVKNPVDNMIHEHDTQFVLLQQIREILDNYKLEENDPSEYKCIVRTMRELDKDLEIHLHLENNILFPKAVELEREKVNL